MKKDKTMAIECLREVTIWNVEYRQPNHTYLLDGDKVLAYQPWGEGDPVYFNTPRKINKRYRKFVKEKVSPFSA